MRRKVAERAGDRCEYCLIHQRLVASKHQVDHVIAEKHGGATELDNLALWCLTCNLRKGSDISSFDPETTLLAALFNPRTQLWSEHFRLESARIVGLTPEGRATVEFLHLNSFERLMERSDFIRAGRLPLGKMRRYPQRPGAKIEFAQSPNILLSPPSTDPSSLPP
jgi:hypothetical protein